MIISQVGSFSFQLHQKRHRKCNFPDQSDFPLLCRDVSLKSFRNPFLTLIMPLEVSWNAWKRALSYASPEYRFERFVKPPSISRLIFSSFFPFRFLFVSPIFHVPTCRDETVIPYNQFHVYSLGTLLAKIFHFRETSYWTVDVLGFFFFINCHFYKNN